MALDAAGLDKARVLHRPRLLSDNGSSYISDDLAKWLERHDMAHVRGAPYHPMTQGKIEEPDSGVWQARASVHRGRTTPHSCWAPAADRRTDSSRSRPQDWPWRSRRVVSRCRPRA